MAQLFRDQCREARCQGGRRALARLWLETLLDLAGSAFREHLSEKIHRMKNIPPKTWSLILFIVSMGAAALCVKFALLHSSPAVIGGLIYLSAIALLMRAAVEWVRPANELIKSLLWGGTIAVIYGVILPMLAKLSIADPRGFGHGTRDPILGAVLMTGIALNGLVPIGKAVMLVWRRRV